MTRPEPLGASLLGFTIQRKRGTLLCLALILVAILSLPNPASAQNRDHYLRSNFTVEDGLPDNVVNTITRTRNGVLWVGTESGLASFDGREFTSVDLHKAGSPSQGAVQSLLEASDGDLWVGTDSGVARISREALDQFDPKLLTFYQLATGASDEVDALLQSRDGAIWAGTNHGLFRFQDGKFIKVLAGTQISRISEALDGHLLLITGRGFLEWDGHRAIDHPGLADSLGVHDDQIFDVSQDRHGTMWYCTNAGVFRRGNHPFEDFLPAGPARTAAFRSYEDSSNNIWILTGIGTYRANGNLLEGPEPNLHARSFYAAPNGDLWMGTNGDGLIRFKPRIVQMYTKADGLTTDITMAVLQARDGRLWVGQNCGLSVLDKGRFKLYLEKDGLLNSCVWALAEDRNQNLWIGTYGGGIFRFRDGKFTQYSIKQGLISKIVRQIAVAQDDSLWIATPDGISHMQNGNIRNFTLSDGLSSNQVYRVYQDASGRIWAATQAGIDRLQGERFVALPPWSSGDRPLSMSFGQDSAGHMYAFNSPAGIGRIGDGPPVMVDENLKVSDMAESSNHDLWFSGTNGILRVSLDELKMNLSDRDTPLSYTRIDRADGLNSLQCSVGSPNVTITSDQKLWVTTVSGLAMIDLRRLPQSLGNPKVLVSSVKVGKDTRLGGAGAILPPGTHHVELHMKVIDLATAEKIRLQYRLDDVDTSWLDADTSRTAVYTNIPSGTHTFHVRSTNGNGVWDRTGIIYTVTQQPQVFETAWFRVLTFSAAILLLTGMYLLRVRYLIRQTNLRMEARLTEREHIARELHDTLLQGFLSASMQLDVVTDRLPENSEVKHSIANILKMMSRVVDECREALRGLRAQGADAEYVELAFSRIAQELAVPTTVEYHVLVHGTPRPLRPLIRDEVYRIGREALVNAFSHSAATVVDVEVEYAPGRLRLLVRDNGCGIDPQMLDSGREGHWGLRGMHERSHSIGASLKLHSRIHQGTEIELVVPGAIAFENHSSNPAWSWLAWFK